MATEQELAALVSTLLSIEPDEQILLLACVSALGKAHFSKITVHGPTLIQAGLACVRSHCKHHNIPLDRIEGVTRAVERAIATFSYLRSIPD